MIRFALRCAAGHEFEGWFRSGDGFAVQQKAGEVSCPDCGDTSVEKALMAPSIGKARPPVSPVQIRNALLELRRQVETNCDYVGERFAEEARRIHYGEIDAHAIYGEATDEESRELVDEGIEIGRIPWISPSDA